MKWDAQQLVAKVDGATASIQVSRDGVRWSLDVQMPYSMLALYGEASDVEEAKAAVGRTCEALQPLVSELAYLGIIPTEPPDIDMNPSGECLLCGKLNRPCRHPVSEIHAAMALLLRVPRAGGRP